MASILGVSILVSLCLTFASASLEADFISNTVSSHKIVIFSKSYCPYCMKAKSIFKELNLVPHVVELNERDDGSKIQDAMMGMFGRRTVPQVFINGKHIGGSSDTVDAYESGEMAKLLGIADHKEEL